MPASNVKPFLGTFIERFLLPDIESVVKKPQAQPPEYLGGCGYPLIMTICSGIELLGTLLSDKPFRPHAPTLPHFEKYWKEYLYPTPQGSPESPRQKAGKGFYKLARHGIAHAFQVKAPITVWKDPNGLPSMPSRHLVQRAGPEFLVDAVQLQVDFRDSYYERFKPDVLRNPTNASARISEMLSAYADEASEVQEAFAHLPLAEK